MLITFCLLRSFAKIILQGILVEKKMSAAAAAATAESAAVVWHAE